MKRFIPFLLALVTALAPFTAHAAGETMAERELKRIVQRQRTILTAAQNAGENMDRSSVEMQLSEVVRDYEALLRKDPKFVAAYVAYGLFLNSAGHPKRSYDIFLKADAIEPNLAVVKNQLANHHAEEGEYDQAAKLYEAAITLEPKEPLYHYQLGMLLYEYREFFVDAKTYARNDLLVRSAAEFRQAAELAPDNMAYGYRHAESFYDLPSPNWDEAIAAWKTLGQRAKPGVELQTIQLHQANILATLGRADEARALLDQITEEPLQPNKQKLIEQLAGTPEKAP
ncbi:MAG TPA: tetratricopeptide repeat protein [Opitutaceae bacterium]|nr:tetratricopeptide repeat protein [Opitutaceae bacterium]